MHADRRGTPGDLVALAVFVGLLGGYVDAGALALRRVLVEPLIFVGRHVWWAAPAMTMLLFLIVATGIYVLGKLVPRVRVWRLGLWCFAALAAFAGLYAFPQVHRLAALALAAGLATATTRWAAPRELTLRRLIRPLALGALLMTAVVSAFEIGSAALRERRELGALPAAEAGAPNVLLLVLDTVRAMSLSLYGYDRPTTPSLEAMGSEGVVFEQAYATAPWTLPSHASMLTGRWMHELSADWMVPLDATFPTLGEVLGRRGYATAGFVANTDYCSAEVGLDRGFARYEDYTLTPGQLLRNSALWRALARIRPIRAAIGNYDNLGRKLASDINRAFLRWLDRQPARPFFAMLNYYDAHRPYFPPAPFERRFTTPDVAPNARYRKEDGNQRYPPPQRIQGAIDAYDSAIAYLDAQLGVLFEELERRGLLRNTILIVTSDHGEEFMEHGLWDHGNTLYAPGLHVPLVIRWPGKIPAGLRVGEPVSVRQIPITVASLLRADSRFPGASLAQQWDGGAKPDTVLVGVRRVPRQPDWYPVAAGDMVGAIAGPWSYIKNLGTGHEELYDVAADPLQQRDLLTDPGSADSLEVLRARTRGLFARTRVPPR